MRILLINQYYYPDIAATAQMCADLAEDLVRLGHDVNVVAGTSWYRAPHRGRDEIPQEPLPLLSEHRGVRIVRVPAPEFLPRGEGLLQKALGYGSFLVGALGRVFEVERPDVVLALSTPPLVAALGLGVQELRRARLVYWVQDVYPELAVALSVMRERWPLERAFSALSRVLYQRADAIVALDDTMALRLVGAGAPAERIRVIDNWCDETEVWPQEPGDNPLRRELRLGTEVAVGYAGNLGRGHDFRSVAAALRVMRHDPLSWLFVGDGPQRARLMEGARGLPRVHFRPPQARERLRDVLTAGDLGLVTMDEQLGGLLVPSKVYGLLAAGRPVVYVGPPDGRVAELVGREELGLSVRNHDVSGLVLGLRRLLQDPALRARMGARAREVFEERYTRALATARHEALLREVLGLPGCSGGPWWPGPFLRSAVRGSA